MHTIRWKASSHNQRLARSNALQRSDSSHRSPRAPVPLSPVPSDLLSPIFYLRSPLPRSPGRPRPSTSHPRRIHLPCRRKNTQATPRVRGATSEVKVSENFKSCAKLPPAAFPVLLSSQPASTSSLDVNSPIPEPHRLPREFGRTSHPLTNSPRPLLPVSRLLSPVPLPPAPISHLRCSPLPAPCYIHIIPRFWRLPKKGGKHLRFGTTS